MKIQGRFFLRAATACQVGVGCMIFASCQAAAVRTLTLEHGESVREILESQVLRNLEAFAADPGSLPDHVRISAGSAQVSSSSKGTAGVQIVSGTDPFSLSAEGTRSWTTNWTIAPVVDRLELERLRFLYQWTLATYEGISREEFSAAYLDRSFSDPYDLGKYLMSLFGSRDMLGRSTAVDWRFQRSGSEVVLHNGKELTYEAVPVPPAKEISDLLAKLELVPRDWFVLEEGKARVTDSAGFRDFVLLTLSPNLSSLDAKAKFDSSIQQAADGPPLYLQQPLLDPTR